MPFTSSFSLHSPFWSTFILTFSGFFGFSRRSCCTSSNILVCPYAGRCDYWNERWSSLIVSCRNIISFPVHPSSSPRLHLLITFYVLIEARTTWTRSRAPCHPFIRLLPIAEPAILQEVAYLLLTLQPSQTAYLQTLFEMARQIQAHIPTCNLPIYSQSLCI